MHKTDRTHTEKDGLFEEGGNDHGDENDLVCDFTAKFGRDASVTRGGTGGPV